MVHSGWWRPVAVVAAACTALSSASILPAGYSLEDPNADHDSVGQALANAAQLSQAIASFKAAARFDPSGDTFANLGVALLRNHDFATAWRALTTALEVEPDNGYAESNLQALYTYAAEHGYERKKLLKLGRKIKLDLNPEREVSTPVREQRVPRPSVEQPRSGESRNLTTAAQIAIRGKELMDRSEKKLGRGYISLALHLNPWLHLSQPWVTELVEPLQQELTYWKGNMLIGYDKTKLEEIMSVKFDGAPEPEVYELGIYTWRDLQLSKHSCCGINNVAVFLSRCREWGHRYIVPFMHLSPHAVATLTKTNQALYDSFKNWWESTGRPSQPDPAIQFDGKDSWEWDAMKVALPPSRVPDGWEAFTQAVLLYRFQEYEGARAALIEALTANSDLSFASDEFMPGLSSLAPPRPGVLNPSSRGKYLVCYNPAVGIGNTAVVMLSAMNLARITGRTLVIHWNMNVVSRYAWELVDDPGVKVLGEALPEMGIVNNDVKDLMLFHIMDSAELGNTLELLGCSDFSSLNAHRIVTISSNLYFTPLLQNNPHTKPTHRVRSLHQGLGELVVASGKATKRALSYATKVSWASTAPVIAVHVRSREEGEDRDDWPTADSPEEDMLEQLALCVEQAIQLEFGDVKEWDVFVAATTEKARKATAEGLRKHARGLRRVLMLPKIERSRRTGAGTVDAMAEALLVSRADVFVRYVVGTSGFSTFAFLANALRWQSAWAASSLPPLRTPGFAPNYVVTDSCSSQHRCFEAAQEVNMARIGWHGKMATRRSCGDVVAPVEEHTGCNALKPAGVQEEEEEEL
eukprot:TRINITY_DN95543_c0_g1_i1.p1 TRINITY_DN95543_c0_g1~~TRINITY_DN95543_c0_g1_i1.p1  ORF type:complete len:807 (+),score=145.97 TRINITY_DN95543_c0_g1_i1:26-2446(+)